MLKAPERSNERNYCYCIVSCMDFEFTPTRNACTGCSHKLLDDHSGSGSMLNVGNFNSLQRLGQWQLIDVNREVLNCVRLLPVSLRRRCVASRDENRPCSTLFTTQTHAGSNVAGIMRRHRGSAGATMNAVRAIDLEL